MVRKPVLLGVGTAIGYRNIWLGNTYYSANMLNIRSRGFDRVQCYFVYGGIHAFFYKQTFRQKVEQMLSNSLGLNFCYLKIIHILHQHYHPEIIGNILKNKQKNKCLCIYKIIGLITMKMKIKMKKDHIDTR